MDPKIRPLSEGKDQKHKDSAGRWVSEFKLLVERDVLKQMRLPISSYVKVMTTLFVSFICVVIYHNVGGDIQGVQNREGALFFLTLNIGFNGLSNVELIFPMERPVFLREVNNDMYSVTAYFWAKIFSELPMSVLIPILQASLTYFAIGFSQVYWYKFPIFCAISVLIYNAFTGLGYILGTAISNPQVAAALNPILIVPTMLFAGFFVD